MQVLRVDGIEIAYERAGSGPPLVLVHGACDDHRGWAPQIEALSADFTVVAWDEPGVGASSDIPAGHTLAAHAHCLAGLIETVGPAHVCGLSWGGTVALELFRQRSDLVRSLILADTYAGWKGSLPQAEVRRRVQEALDAVGEPGLRASTLRIQAPLMAEADLNDVLPTIDVPTLLIWGEDDPRSPLSIARSFKAAIPHAELVVIPGAGHVSNLDRPDEFNAAIRRFCGTVA